MSWAATGSRLLLRLWNRLRYHFFFLVELSVPTLLSDSIDSLYALLGERNFLNHLVFLYLVGIGLDMELFNDRELWQRSFSLSNVIWSVPSVHIDDEIVDCEPIFGRLLHSFLRLVGVLGDDDFGDFNFSRRFGAFGESTSVLSLMAACVWSIVCEVDVLSISVMVILRDKCSCCNKLLQILLINDMNLYLQK